MNKHAHGKQERIIEAVRQGLEGEAAVELVRECGYALTGPAMVRHLRHMGGRRKIAALIAEGKNNIEILEALCPEEEFHPVLLEHPAQGDLFSSDPFGPQSLPFLPKHAELFETTKLVVHLPNEVYEALRLYAHAEKKSRNEAVVDLLTSALSRLPHPTAPDR